MKTYSRQCNRRAGFTLLELMIAASIMSVIMASMIVGLQREAQNLGDLVTTTHRERSAQVVLHRIEELLEFAAGAAPAAWLSNDIGGGTGTLQVDSSLGFPPTGTLLLEPGSGSEERLDFTGLDRVTHTLTGLDRGVQCTGATGHLSGARVIWAGGATALENQLAPPAAQWDGQMLTEEGPLFYRGDGTGFSFRVPTDPAGGADYFDATGIRWGAKVDGAPNANGWSALMFVATRQLTEAQAGRDINGDGDQIDVFDLGQIRLLHWDAMANGVPDTDVALCPPIIAQEVCNYGGDLDGDGFQDPIFLWNPNDGSLRVRLLIVSGLQNTRAAINQTGTTMYMRNGSL